MLSINNYYISLSLLIFANTLAISGFNRFYIIVSFILFFFLTIRNCWDFLRKEKSTYFVFACIIFIITPSSFSFWGGVNSFKLVVVVYVSIYLMWLVNHLYDLSVEKIDFLETVARTTLFLYIIYYLSDIVLNSFVLDNFTPPLISVYVPLSIAIIYIPTKILLFATCALIVAFFDKDRTGVLICSIALIYFFLEKSKYAINKKLFLSSLIVFPYLYLIIIILIDNLFDISGITTNRSNIANHWWKILINYPELLLSGFGDNTGYALIFSKNNSGYDFSDYSQPHNIVLGEVIRMGLLSVSFFSYLMFRIMLNVDIHRLMVPTLLFLIFTFSFGGPSNLIAFHPLNVIFFLFFFSMMKVGKSD